MEKAAANPEFSVIFAMAKNGGFANNGQLPWKLSKEMAHFSKVTLAKEHREFNVVIMGRRTWESLPETRRPLKGRYNIIVSKTMKSGYNTENGARVTSTLQEALDISTKKGKIFVIGGKALIKKALSHPSCTELYLTRIDKEYPCDTFIKPDLSRFTSAKIIKDDEEDQVKFTIMLYKR